MLIIYEEQDKSSLYIFNANIQTRHGSNLLSNSITKYTFQQDMVATY